MHRVIALMLGTVAAGLLVAAPARPQSGAEIFHARCAKCHGETGKTEPAIARAL